MFLTAADQVRTQATPFPPSLNWSFADSDTVVPLTISRDFIREYHDQSRIETMSTILAEDQTPATTLLVLRVGRYQMFEETFGLTVGSDLISQIKSKVGQLLRDSDVLVQVAADEFLVLLDQVSQSNRVVEITTRLIAECTYVQIHGQEHIPINIDIGVARFPQHSRDPEELLRFARIALHQADPDQSGACHFYSAKVLNRTRSKVAMISKLMEALCEKRMELYYQPIYSLANRRMIGVEALARMRQPSGTLIEADKFIHVAEDSGLIIPLGKWVFNQACQQLARWKLLGSKDLIMSINVSPCQIRDANFIDDVARAVCGAGIQYAEIKLDIVESKAIDGNSRASDALGELRSRGVLIAVDDFGTGCSSLSSLTQLPLDVIKVDRSFMLQTPFNQQARGIVSALFCLAQELGLQVTVEGVETDEQEQFLKDLGCESAQGFGYAKPMCADDLWDFYQLNH